MTIADISIFGLLYLSSLLAVWYHLKKNHRESYDFMVPVIVVSMCMLLSITGFTALQPTTSVSAEENASDVLVVDLHNFQRTAIWHMQREEYEEALAVYRTARFYFPDHADLANNMGVMHGFLGNKEKEIQYYNEALAIDPSFEAAQTNLHEALGLAL